MNREDTKFFELKAFTLMELLVVVVILGTVICASIPRYQKAVEQAYERTGAQNLNMVRSAIKMYKMNNGSYPNGNLNNTAAVNSTLGLMILPDKLTYRCNSNSG